MMIVENNFLLVILLVTLSAAAVENYKDLYSIFSLVVKIKQSGRADLSRSPGQSLNFAVCSLVLYNFIYFLMYFRLQ